jgi:hypothetical protein
VTYRANARREAIRDLAEMRDRLEAAGDALTGTEAALKQAEARFAAADEPVAAARTPCTPPTPAARQRGRTAAPPGRRTCGRVPWWNACNGA